MCDILFLLLSIIHPSIRNFDYYVFSSCDSSEQLVLMVQGYHVQM